MKRLGDEANPALAAENDTFRVYQVRWPALEGVQRLISCTGTCIGPSRRTSGEARKRYGNPVTWYYPRQESNL